MEKRVLLAVFLSFLVLFVYQSVFVKRTPGPGQASAAKAAPDEAPAPDQAVEKPVPSASGPMADVPAAVVADTEEHDIVVESDAVKAVFTSRGAVLKTWLLKKHHEGNGQPVDLVPSVIPADAVRPFALRLNDAALSARVNGALFRPSATGLRLGPEPSVLSFEFSDADGLRVRKEFRLSAATPYEIRFSASVTKGDEELYPAIAWGPAIGNTDTASVSGYYQKPQGIYSVGGDVSRLDASSLSKEAVHEGTFEFAGVDDHYFIAVALPGGKPLKVEYQPISVPVNGAPHGLVAFDLRYPEGATDARFFFGPKEFDVLAATDGPLVRSIHFGIFGFLVVPLLRALKWVDAYVGNYGWSIVILTILINAAMFPLRHKSVVSMRKMQEIQPEVKAIQERYSKLKSTDPAKQKMNTEMMNLYRERGVNPASGCLPMLLTMPVLFAFYSLLSVAIEIRGAPFILWITDLSLHDPWYVTPLLMGGTMVWQQRLTPTAGDPTQQRIMMFMPLMFTVMFLWAPSGLVIYWLMSNLWGIGQQHVTNRLIGPPPQRNVRPAAERRVKKAPVKDGDSQA